MVKSRSIADYTFNGDGKREYPTHLRRHNNLINGSIWARKNHYKIMLLAMAEVVKNPNKDRIAILPVSYIQDRLKLKGRSIYEDIQELSRDDINVDILIRDIENPTDFIRIYAIESVAYKSSKIHESCLVIKFTPSIMPYISRISENATNMKLDILMDYSSFYALRLYEIIDSYAWQLNKLKTGRIVIKFSTAELRCKLGTVEFSGNKKQTLMQGAERGHITWDEVIAQSDEIKYPEVGKFNADVIKKSINSINKDMAIPYKVTYKNVGKPITHTNIILELKEQIAPSSSSSDEISLFLDNMKEDTPKMINRVLNLIDMELNLALDEDDIIKLWAKAKSLEKVERAVQALVEYSAEYEVENPIGFLLEAIRKDWSPNELNENEQLTLFDTMMQGDPTTTENYNKAIKYLLKPYEIKTKEIISLHNVSKGDFELVKKAIFVLLGKESVRNMAGFLISAIERGFEDDQVFDVLSDPTLLKNRRENHLQYLKDNERMRTFLEKYENGTLKPVELIGTERNYLRDLIRVKKFAEVYEMYGV